MSMTALAASMILTLATPVESFVEAPGPQGPLKGTMLAPAEADGPVMLIIPGSGPTDRDGNSPLGIKASTYKLLAEGLAARGVTTVRVDKRGMFASGAAVSDANAVSIADYVADVRSWTKAIRERTGAPCVWLLGHSEGGLVAMAAEDSPDICGLVLVAAPGRPLGTVLREQLKANPANAPLLEQAEAAIDTLEVGGKVDTANLHPALASLFGPQIQGFLISLFSYEPAQLLAASDKPVLVVQGQKDIQVSEADARLLGEARDDVRLVLIPDANHVLKSVASDDRAANMASYADPSLPLADGVVRAIADFVGDR